ncbi:MAG: hypothetical protein ACRDD1_03310 [Planctomycetia bacterium]
MPVTTQTPPGVTVSRTVVDRQILSQAARDHVVVETIVLDAGGVDGANADVHRLRAGWLLARIDATGRYVPCKRTVVVAPPGSSSVGASTAVFIRDAAPFKAGDVVTVGDDVSVTVAAVDYVAKKLTLSAAITATPGDKVFAPNGAGVARGLLLDDEVDLWNADRTATTPKTGRMLVAGLTRHVLVLGDLAAAQDDPVSARKLRLIAFDAEQFGAVDFS